MKKIILIIAALLLLGAAAVSALFLLDGGKTEVTAMLSLRVFDKKPAMTLDESAVAAVQAIKDQDFTALSKLVSPEKGVLFVPYSTVDTDKNLCFTQAQVAAFGSDATKYIWGLTDGEGAPIELTPAAYFKTYVYDKDYLTLGEMNENTIAESGNSLENVQEAFPDADFVEFHIEGSEEYSGMDWSGLKLVFEAYKGTLYLVAIIHSQWTI